MILLSDADVLIDLCHVNGLELLAQLAPAEVLDVVLNECEHPSQPSLVSTIHRSGVKVVTTQLGWVEAAMAYKSAELSSRDQLNLYYAKAYQRVLLSGHLPLRERCIKEDVMVHGSLWIIEEAFRRQLVAANELCRWLKIWSTLGSHLPPSETRRLAKRMGCR